MSQLHYHPSAQSAHERRAEMERWRKLAILHRETAFERAEPYIVVAILTMALLSTLIAW